MDSGETVLPNTESGQVHPSPENRLCRMLTGVGFEEDPGAVMRRMISDRVAFSEKYGISLSESYTDRHEYARYLLSVAKNGNIPVKMVDRSVLDEHEVGAGVTGEGKIVVPSIDLETCTDIQAYNWSVKFGHELTHILQTRQNPDISIEQAEYEAYVLTYLPTAFNKYANEYPGVQTIQLYMTDAYMFELIRDSCLDHYEKTGVSRGNIPWMVDTEQGSGK